MAISNDLIRQAVEALAGIEGVFMDPASLVEDVFLFAYAFPEQEDFMAACASTSRALGLLMKGAVDSSNLKYQLEGWDSYHYQHRAGQGVKADCRIMYRRIDGGIEVKGFGHRRIPADFYIRMGEKRLG
ncbi:MAG: hypothetical protein ACI4B9_02220 [Eggerthellaceae bacterium]